MIKKILNIEEKEYQWNLSRDEFIIRFEKVVQQESKPQSFSFAGQLKNGRNFFLSKRLFSADSYSNKLEIGPALIKGKFLTDSNKLILRVKFRPNATFSIFTILFPMIGLYMLISSFFVEVDNINLIFSFLFLFVGIACYIIGDLLKNNIKNKFEESFGLKNE